MNAAALIPVDPLTLASSPEDALPAAAQAALFDGSDGCFAVLDAAACPGLVEMIEESRLPHACLFQGAALENLRDVAPWIVELRPEAAFTRALLSRDDPDPPWFLWGKQAGIFLRSAASLRDIRKHFRKFTKVTDETGKAYYFRFYEPTTLPDFLNGLDPARRAQFMGPVTRILCPTEDGLVDLTA